MNKWALLALPFPGVVTACQFLTTAVVVYFLGKFRVVDVDAFRWEKLKAMAPINVVFYLAIFTNGQVLTYSTVETFIAFRSLTPLLVSGVDTLVRGEAPPSRRTAACLLLIALGAVSYARDDANFSVRGRAAKESEIPTFKGSYLGRFPLVSADFWTSDRPSGRSRRVDAFPGTRAQETVTLKRT